MIAIHLPPEADAALEKLAKATGTSKDSHALKAMLEYLEDWEDAALAEKALHEFRSSGEKPLTLQEVKARLGLDG